MVAIKEDGDLDLTEIQSLLERVAQSIHQQPNRVKYVMNNFVTCRATSHSNTNQTPRFCCRCEWLSPQF